MVDDKARCTAGCLLDMFALNVIDLDLLVGASLRVPGCESTGLFKDAVRKFFSLRANDNVRTRDSLCMEPPVIAVCDLEGDFLVLIVVLADVDVKAVGRAVVIRTARDLRLLCAKRTLLDKAKFRELFFDLNEVFLPDGDVEGGTDRLEVIDLLLRLGGQIGQSLKRSLELIVFAEILLCVFLSGELRIERNLYFFVLIVV